MRNLIPSLCLVALLGTPLPAQDLPPQKLAQLLAILSGGPIACPNATVRNALDTADPKPTWDPNAKVAFANTLAEVQRLAREGKTVVTTDQALLHQGATVAIVQVDGKTRFVTNKKNYKGGFTDQATRIVFAN